MGEVQKLLGTDCRQHNFCHVSRLKDGNLVGPCGRGDLKRLTQCVRVERAFERFAGICSRSD